MMQDMKFWFRLQEQRKNNRGSSLITVLGVMALVMIMVSVLMSISAMNLKMKYTDINSKKNFYTAESALEEIREALIQQVSDASSEAYIASMEAYGNLDPAVRSDYFKQEYAKYFQSMAWYDNSNPSIPVYKTSELEGFLRETKSNAKVSAPVGQNIINLDQAGIILKNVIVTYRNSKDYITQIQTDIVLKYPEIDFAQISGMPNLLSYALVADDSFLAENMAGGRSQVTGNAYLGENGAEISSAEVDFQNPMEETTKSLVVTNGLMKVSNGGTLNCDGIELWASDLTVDSSTAEIGNGGSTVGTAVYLNNDLVLSKSSAVSAKVSIAGEYYGYGNVDTAVAASSLAGDAAKQNEMAVNPAKYSSSIIVNGGKTQLNLSGLSKMMIAGNTYVNGMEFGTNTANVLMGESISVKSDQLAYLIPYECVAPGMVNGGANPMTAEQYQKLLAELKDNYGKEDSGYDATKDLVNYTVPAEMLGNISLHQLGVNGYQLEAYPVNTGNLGCMVYLFMKFDTVASANEFFQTYYAENKNLTTLGKMLDLYTAAGVQLPNDILDATKMSEFYFNGNILADGNTDIYIPERLSSLAGNTQRSAELAEEQMSYQDSFSALGRKLVKNYSQLTAEEKRKDVYGNLVKSFTTNPDIHYVIAPGDKKIFVSNGGEAAVVVNGNYQLDAATLTEVKSTPDIEGNCHGDAKLHVVIASGDVTVEQDFNGLILAGGRIIIDHPVNITADAQAAGRALRAENNAGFCAADYLVNGSSYLLGGSAGGAGSVEDTGISMEDCVVYENWKKQ